MQHTSVGIDLSGVKDMAPTAVHHLPCKIKLDGHAAVSTYFRPDIESAPRTVHFRGRLLKGKQTELPAGTEGFVFREQRASTTAARARDAAGGAGDDGEPSTATASLPRKLDTATAAAASRCAAYSLYE